MQWSTTILGWGINTLWANVVMAVAIPMSYISLSLQQTVPPSGVVHRVMVSIIYVHKELLV